MRRATWIVAADLDGGCLEPVRGHASRHRYFAVPAGQCMPPCRPTRSSWRTRRRLCPSLRGNAPVQRRRSEPPELMEDPAWRWAALQRGARTFARKR